MNASQQKIKQAEALHQKAQAQQQNQAFSDAIETLSQLLALELPEGSHLEAETLAGIYNQRAILYFEEAQLLKAQKDWLTAIEHAPQASFWFNLGRSHAQQNSFEGHAEALRCFRKAIGLNTNHAQAWNSMGNLFLEQNKVKKAVHAYQKSIAVSADWVEPHINLAIAYTEIHKHSAAKKLLLKCQQQHPDHPMIMFNLGLINLKAGLLKTGFAQYEKARWQLNPRIRPAGNLQRPLWQGEPVERLLICHEQGFGDSIQFCRYLSQASQLTEHLYVEMPPQLYPLMQHFSGDLRCPITFIQEGEPLPDTESWCPMMRLPALFAKNEVTDKSAFAFPYFNIDTTKELPNGPIKQLTGPKYKIGIVWAAGKSEVPGYAKLSQRKSVSPDFFEPLIAHLTHAQFFNFQVGPETKDIAGTINIANACKNFYDTACFIKQMDLIISVDTATAHLAGALNKPVWTLLSDIADWRWFLEKQHSRWYPSMRLFRKPLAGTWEALAYEVEQALLTQP